MFVNRSPTVYCNKFRPKNRTFDLPKKRIFFKLSGINCQIWKWEIVNPNDPDQDNGTKLLYCHRSLTTNNNHRSKFQGTQVEVKRVLLTSHCRTTRELIATDRGRGSLVVKETDSWPACHKFEPSTADNPPRRERCTLNLSRAQTSSSGVVVRRVDASSGVIRPWFKNMKTVAKSPRVVFIRVDVNVHSVIQLATDLGILSHKLAPPSPNYQANQRTVAVA
ncbi:hypothetical protein TNCV_155291 [Trichonephila clavipes]|uniref:Uncharacterized protein n=1 Tax=Trichonephila clavipes TaxID=2585209 RepID=A0A8X6WIW7_TRICX|nr:hypothetical protein TNCV_155291 [Trichonephila clavipes]